MYVNTPLCHMFGYQRSELMGKSVSVLMPSPLAEMHSQLVRRYVTTGEERVINKHLEHMVINRAKQVGVLLGLAAHPAHPSADGTNTRAGREQRPMLKRPMAKRLRRCCQSGSR